MKLTEFRSIPNRTCSNLINFFIKRLKPLTKNSQGIIKFEFILSYQNFNIKIRAKTAFEEYNEPFLAPNIYLIFCYFK